MYSLIRTKFHFVILFIIWIQAISTVAAIGLEHKLGSFPCSVISDTVAMDQVKSGTISDNNPPAWDDPNFFIGIVNVECQEDQSPTALGIPTAKDDSGDVDVTWSDEFIAGSCPGNYSISRTWVARDSTGNYINGVQQISVNDIQSPVMVCRDTFVSDPNDIFSPNDLSGINFSDNCGIDTILLVDEQFGYSLAEGVIGSCPKTVKRSYAAYDQCGNQQACEQLITVQSGSDCGFCQDEVPYKLADLNNAPDSVWVLDEESLSRQGSCCTNVDSINNLGCISFNVYLDRRAIGLVFDVNKQIPSEHEYYHVNCEDSIRVGEFICLAGGEFYTLTYCNSSEDNFIYTIQSFGGVITEDSISITNESENSIELKVSGAEPSSIEWSVKYPLDSDYLLDCLDTTDNENTLMEIDSLKESLIIFEVCAKVPEIICGGDPVYDCSDIVINNCLNDTVYTDLLICEGESPYLWNGYLIEDAGMYFYNLTSSQGCETISILDVHVIPITRDTINVDINRGSNPYSWNGHTIDTYQDSSYISHLVNSSGCDSIVHYNVDIKTTTSNHFINRNVSLLNIFPNPNRGIFTIEIKDVLNNYITLEIFDNSGRIITNEDYPVSNGIFSKNINISMEKSGMYHLKIYDGSNTFSRSIIVQ